MTAESLRLSAADVQITPHRADAGKAGIGGAHLR
jgi:hypothetical protein